MKKSAATLLLSGFLSASLSGCMESLDKQVEKDPNSIIGKKTQAIGKLDKNAGGQRVMPDRPQVKVTNVVTGGLEAYGPMLEQISKSHIHHALQLFNAEHDRYPKDYDEFMSVIIKANNIQLPVLPGGLKYMYDEENHKLVVVKLDADPKDAK